jgi:hypothetical protein
MMELKLIIKLIIRVKVFLISREPMHRFAMYTKRKEVGTLGLYINSWSLEFGLLFPSEI